MALLAVGGVGVTRLVTGEAGAIVSAQPRAATAPGPAASARPLAIISQRPEVNAGAAAAVPARAAGGRSAADADDDDSMEICGYGRVTKAEAEAAMAHRDRQPAWLERVKAVLTQRPNQGLSQLSARLAVGSDAERVAGRLIMDDVEGAAAIAAQSRDAAAYRLGLAGCGFGERSGGAPSCQGLSIQGWIERDPADARPWLSLAGRSASKHNEAAVGEALAEALKRPKLSSSEPLMPVAMKVAQVVVTDRVELGRLSLDVMGQQAAMSDWSVTALASYCGPAGIKDGQRLPLCRQLAVKLMDGADNFMEAQVAQSVADRVGVPAEQRRYDKATLTAAQQRFIELTTHDKAFGLDCASFGRVANLFAERTERGELQMALDLLKRGAPASAAR
jgi:hypothetical protein